MKTAAVKHTETFTIMSYDGDFKQRIKPASLLGYMQEAATNHAEALGLGFDASMAHGFFWVLGRIKYELYRMPLVGEKMEISTWPVGIDGICVLRRFAFAVEGKKVGEAFNYWLTLDAEKKRPIRSEYFLEVIREIPVDENDYFKIMKVPGPKEMPVAFEKTIRQSDLDWNNHVNNVRYADLVYDALPFDIVSNQDLTGFQINYLKEMKINDQVAVMSDEADGVWHIKGCVGGKEMFNAAVEMNTVDGV